MYTNEEKRFSTALRKMECVCHVLIANTAVDVIALGMFWKKLMGILKRCMIFAYIERNITELFSFFSSSLSFLIYPVFLTIIFFFLLMDIDNKTTPKKQLLILRKTIIRIKTIMLQKT